MDKFFPTAATARLPAVDVNKPTWDDTPEFRRQRHDMVRRQILARGIRHPHLVRALSRLPRQLFTRPEERHAAYCDQALPADHGQSLSQPFIVAVMTEQLELRPEHRVLEIGTGTGYQTALLAMLCAKVYTVEYVPELSLTAHSRLQCMGFTNISFCTGDGSMGWEAHSPYDAIMVTAGAEMVPEPLVKQLANAGRMIIPIGDRNIQMLKRIERNGDAITERDILDCRFVPLLGQWGWRQ